MNYYSFHIGDYTAHTKHLTPLEDIVYRRIVDIYYLDEKPVNGTAKDVARRICMNDCLTDVEQVLNEFFVFNEKGNCWTNKRCDAEIKKFKDKSKKASEAGKASVLSRQNNKINNKHTTSERSTDVKQTLNQPITNNQEPITKDKNNTSLKDDFSLFWNTYPKKIGKADAMKIWKRLKPPITDVLKALKWQIASEQWIKGFIPNPSTYLNQGRWEDEPPINGVKQPKIAWYDTEEATECKAKELGLKRLPDEDLGYYRERIQNHISGRV